MNKGSILNTALLTAALVALFVVLPKLQLSKDSITAGSVTVGNEYQATSTRNTAGTAMGTNNLIKLGVGTLGSVVITGANTGVMTLLDATSSTDLTGQVLAQFPASAAAGTYTLDVSFTHGLLYQVSGAAPTSTITSR